MRPSEVRARVLEDHVALRGRLDALERLARDVIASEQPRAPRTGGLRTRAQELLTRLREHMRWEDRHLAPALEDADAWGPERAERLSEDHREQREFLGQVVERLEDERQPPAQLAANLLDLIDRLHRDMEEEEGFFLSPDVLRDDVIGIDVETG